MASSKEYMDFILEPLSKLDDVDIFGDGMKEFYKSGSEGSRHINYWLADNCFGDYYTRGGLTLAERELVTVCYSYALEVINKVADKQSK